MFLKSQDLDISRSGKEKSGGASLIMMETSTAATTRGKGETATARRQHSSRRGQMDVRRSRSRCSDATRCGLRVTLANLWPRARWSAEVGPLPNRDLPRWYVRDCVGQARRAMYGCSVRQYHPMRCHGALVRQPLIDGARAACGHPGAHGSGSPPCACHRVCVCGISAKARNSKLRIAEHRMRGRPRAGRLRRKRRAT